MSDAERRLLLSGTLDTSGIHPGDHAFLPEVASAWQDVTVAEEAEDLVSAPESASGDVELPNGRVVPASEVQEVTFTNPDGSTVQGLSITPTEEELAAAKAVETAPEVPVAAPPKAPVRRTAVKKTPAPKK
ncbi:hypothetical protein ACH4S8_37705 [Streptomyces sp. NPDC021080]|uniref:hypothetical protein n=1 Tax=Streptomyces sp. NPDC021080 TaxID=3365110 RepID=UPI0037B1288B